MSNLANPLTSGPAGTSPGLAVEVAVHFDPVCPWCYIGKRRLDRALDRCGRQDVLVRWLPFQLNPGMPAEGMERTHYLTRKFGGPERARLVYDGIRREAEADGISFAFARIRRTPNTLLAHRLVRLGARTGRASEVADALFRAYFQEGRDIGARADLVSIAAEAGIAGSVAALLDGDAERDEVLAEDAAARAAGITGVPNFTIGGRFVLPGAQSPEILIRALELARALVTSPQP